MSRRYSRNRRSRRTNRQYDEARILAEAARQQKLKSIHRQALQGFLITLVGIGVGLAAVASVGEARIEADPTPLMPALVIGCAGVLWMCIARWRKMFMSVSSFASSMGKGAIRALAEELG